jgi:hypothetical protein
MDRTLLILEGWGKGGGFYAAYNRIKDETFAYKTVSQYPKEQKASTLRPGLLEGNMLKRGLMQDKHEKPRPIMVGIVLLMLWLAATACVQDCMGINYTIKGVVLDNKSQPIANAIVHAWNYDDFDQKPFGASGKTNSEGRFDLGKVYSFACTPFRVEAYAEGYNVEGLRSNPPAEYTPLEVDLVIHLKRKRD